MAEEKLRGRRGQGGPEGNRQKRKVAILICSIFIGVFAWFSSEYRFPPFDAVSADDTASSSSSSSSSPFLVQFLLSGGVRGQILPVSLGLASCSPSQLASNSSVCFGGISRRSAFIQRARARQPNRTLTIDAANNFFGGGTLFRELERGAVIARWLALSSYDAIGLGTADFFGGPLILGDFLGALPSSVGVLCSNLDATREPAIPKDRIEGFRVVQLEGGRRIGIVACTDPELRKVSSPGTKLSLNGDGNYTCTTLLTRSISQLKRANPDVNIIVAISSASETNRAQAKEIALAVEDVDVVLSEFPPEDLTRPLTTVQSIFGTPVVIASIPQISSPVYFLGGSMLSLLVQFDEQGLLIPASVDLNVHLLDRHEPDDPRLWNPSATSSSEGQVNAALASLSKLGQQEIGVLGHDLDGALGTLPANTSWSCKNAACGIGQLITESFLHWCQDCSVAHFNAGGLRRDLTLASLTSPPLLTRGDLQFVLPFSNVLISYNILGTDLYRQIIGRSVSVRGSSAFQQLAGIRVAFNPNEKTIVYMEIFDRRLRQWRHWDGNENYRVVTTLFILNGGDGYSILPFASNINLFGTNDVENVIAFLRTMPNRTRDLPTHQALDACWQQPFAVVNSWNEVPAFCNYAASSSILNLAAVCPTLNDTSFCAPGKLLYEGKFFHANNSACSRCSGLGECAENGLQTCVCDGPATSGFFRGVQMIQGSACEQVRTLKAMPNLLKQALWLAGGLTAAVLFFCLFCYIMLYMRSKPLSDQIPSFRGESRVSPPTFFLLLWFGCGSGVASCALLLSPFSDSLCATLPWTLNFAFSFTLGALVTRAWQIKQQHLQQRRKHVGSGQEKQKQKQGAQERAQADEETVYTHRALLLFTLILSVDLILLPMQSALSPPLLSLSVLDSSACTVEQKTVVQSDWSYELTCSSSSEVQVRIYMANIIAKTCIALWALAITGEIMQQGDRESTDSSFVSTAAHPAEKHWLRTSVFQLLGLCLLLLLLLLSESGTSVVIGGSVCCILAIVLLILGGACVEMGKQHRREEAETKERKAKREAKRQGNGKQGAVIDERRPANEKDKNSSASSSPSSSPSFLSPLPPSSREPFYLPFSLGFLQLKGRRALLVRGCFRAYGILFSYYRLVLCFYLLNQLPVSIEQVVTPAPPSTHLQLLDVSRSPAGRCRDGANSFELLSSPICAQTGEGTGTCGSPLFIASLHSIDGIPVYPPLQTCSAHTLLNLAYVFILFYLVYEGARHAYILLPAVAFLMHEEEGGTPAASDTSTATALPSKPSLSLPNGGEENNVHTTNKPVQANLNQHEAAAEAEAAATAAAGEFAVSPVRLHPFSSIHASSPSSRSFRILYRPPSERTSASSSAVVSPSAPASSNEVHIRLTHEAAAAAAEVPNSSSFRVSLTDTGPASAVPSSALASNESKRELNSARSVLLSRFYRSVWSIPLYLYRPVLLISFPAEELAALAREAEGQEDSSSSSWLQLAPYLLIEMPFTLTSLVMAIAFQKATYQTIFAALSALKLTLEISACWGQRVRKDIERLQQGTIKFQ